MEDWVNEERKIPRDKSKNKRPNQMSAAEYIENARQFVIRAGGNRQWDDTRSSWLYRSAATLGIDPARASGYFYKKIRNIPVWEYAQMAERIAQMDSRIQSEQEVTDALRKARSGVAAPVSCTDAPCDGPLAQRPSEPPQRPD
jgi:hypothetical protein